jgi:hypothetical protein
MAEKTVTVPFEFNTDLAAAPTDEEVLVMTGAGDFDILQRTAPKAHSSWHRWADDTQFGDWEIRAWAPLPDYLKLMKELAS